MYNSETWKDAGYKKMKRHDKNSVYLWDGSKTELWVKSPHFAGYTVIIGKTKYEFIATVPEVRFCEEHQVWEEK